MCRSNLILLPLALILLAAAGQSQGPPLIRWGQSGCLSSVHALAVSSDGRHVTCTTVDGPTLLFGLEDGVLVRTFDSGGTALAISPDGRHLATTSLEGDLHIWRIADGSRPLQLEAAVGYAGSDVAFSPDSTLLATAGYYGVRFWCLSDGMIVRTMGTFFTRALAFSPDGETIALGGGQEDSLTINRVADGSVVRVLNAERCMYTDLAYSPDGRLLAAADSTNSRVVLWRIEDGASLVLDSSYRARYVAFSPDGKIVAAAKDRGGARLYNAEDGTLIVEFAASGSQWFNGLAFTPDGTYLVTAGGDYRLQVWDIEARQLARTIGACMSRTSIRYLASSLPANTVAVADWSRVKLVSLSDGSQITTFTGHTEEVRGLSFSSDGQTLATISADRTALIWSVPSGTLLRSIQLPKLPVALDLSPDGELLAVSLWEAQQPSTVRVYRTADGEVASEMGDLALPPLSVRFSPDGQLLIVGVGESIAVWRTSDWQVERWLPTPPGLTMQLTFMANGRMLAAAFWDDIQYKSDVLIWETSTWLLLQQITPVQVPIRAMGFLRDGELLACSSASQASVLYIYSVKSGHLTRVLMEDCLGITSLDTLSNGDSFVFGRYDGSVHLASLGDTVTATCIVPLAGWVGGDSALVARRMPLSLNGWSQVSLPKEAKNGTAVFTVEVPAYGEHRIRIQPFGFLSVAERFTTVGEPVQVLFAGPSGDGALPGDTDRNDVVDLLDVNRILVDWGQAPPPEWRYSDINGDGVVDAVDLFGVIASFGLRGTPW